MCVLTREDIITSRTFLLFDNVDKKHMCMTYVNRLVGEKPSFAFVLPTAEFVSVEEVARESVEELCSDIEGFDCNMLDFHNYCQTDGVDVTETSSYLVHVGDYDDVIGYVNNQGLGYEKTPGLYTDIREESIRTGHKICLAVSKMYDTKGCLRVKCKKTGKLLIPTMHETTGGTYSYDQYIAVHRDLGINRIDLLNRVNETFGTDRFQVALNNQKVNVDRLAGKLAELDAHPDIVNMKWRCESAYVTRKAVRHVERLKNRHAILSADSFTNNTLAYSYKRYDIIACHVEKTDKNRNVIFTQ